MIYKKIIPLIIFLGLLLPYSAKLQAQERNAIELPQESIDHINRSKRFAMGVSSPMRLNSALMMYETFVHNGIEFDKYEILIWGKVVADLKVGGEWEDKFAAINKDDRVKVTVCEFAMGKLKIDKDELIPSLTTFPDAFSRVYELQSLGYHVLIP